MSVQPGTLHELVNLRDGSKVLIRPIEPRDREMLLAGFETLSPESRYRRFFTPLTTLDSNGSRTSRRLTIMITRRSWRNPSLPASRWGLRATYVCPGSRRWPKSR